MNVIIEGPDGSGKSTLAKALCEFLPLRYVPGEGPEKYPSEVVERAERYLNMDGCLFDRHPCISQPIYGSFREGSTKIPSYLVDQMWETSIVIYCYGRIGDHQLKDYDTEDHIRLVEDNDRGIRSLYEEWASTYSYHVIRHQAGEDSSPIIEILRRELKL